MGENPFFTQLRSGRSTSFDEFPELWNILKGDMSIVEERGIIETTKKMLIFQWVSWLIQFRFLNDT